MAGKSIPVYDIDNLGYGGYMSVLFKKGSGIHEIDFNAYAIVPGSVFVLFPGQAHTWKVSKEFLFSIKLLRTRDTLQY